MKAWKGVWFKVVLGFYLSWGALESGLVIERPPQVPLPAFDRHIHCLSLKFSSFHTRLINRYLFCASQQSMLNPVTLLCVCFVGACVCSWMSSPAFAGVRLWSAFSVLLAVGSLFRDLTSFQRIQLLQETEILGNILWISVKAMWIHCILPFKNQPTSLKLRFYCVTFHEVLQWSHQSSWHILVPEVRALHTAAICYGKWHHGRASAAS